MVKNIHVDDETGRIHGNNGAGLKIDLLKNMTDIKENESVEDFVLRHGGLESTIEYISNC